MIYEKTLPTKKYKYKKITITDFSQGQNSSLNGELSKYSKPITLYNYITKNGKLQTSYGLDYLTLPTSESDSDATMLPSYESIGVDYQGVWVYKYYDTESQKNSYDLILYGANGYLYWISLLNGDSNIYRLYEIVLTSKPTIINYRMSDRNYLLICSETDGMIAWDGVTIPTKIASAPNIRSVAVYKNRLFALVSNKFQIRYSKELNPTNWVIDGNADNSGIIRLSDQLGGTSKIIEFMGSLYVIRDNGISKIIFYEDDDSYKISHIFFAGSMIYGESVVCCEREIYFATRDGIFTFDGVTVEKVNLNIDMLFGIDNQQGAKAVFHKGKYYLACRLNYNDNSFMGDEMPGESFVNNTILALDIKSKKFELMRGVDAVDIMPLEVGRISKLVVLTRGTHSKKLAQINNSGEYFGQSLMKVYKANKYSFDKLDDCKIVKNFCILSTYDVEIKIKTDLTQKDYSIKGSAAPQKVVVNLPGNLIEFEICSLSSDADISAFSIEVMCDG